MTVTDIINVLLEREGEEFTDDPVDRGGATKWGVTLETLNEFRGCPVSIQQLQNLTREEAFEVFEHLYVQRSGFTKLLDDRLQVMMVDWGVNSGIRTATKQLQRILGVEPDGVCGPVTQKAANTLSAKGLLKSLGKSRQDFYVSIVIRDPSQIKWLHGWLNRNWDVAVTPL